MFTLCISSLLALEAYATEKKDVYYNAGSIVIEDSTGIRKFITPKALIEHGNFNIKIERERIEPEEIPAAVSLKDKIEARRIMYEANQTFFNGEIAKTWDLVKEAEALDPTYYRIKTMKGSLLYKIGSRDLAEKVWLESLEQNPDQPAILSVLNAGRNIQQRDINQIIQAKSKNDKTKSNL